MPQDILFGYVIVVSVVSAFLVAHDKSVANSKAKGKAPRRVPERMLWTFAILGGATSMYITMRIIRHKTKHRSFMVGLPVVMVLQITLTALLEQLW